MMATVDVRTGTIFEPPLATKGSLHVPLDILSEMKIDYRPDSSLLVYRNACQNARTKCGTHFFVMKSGHFELVKFIPVDKGNGDTHFRRLVRGVPPGGPQEAGVPRGIGREASGQTARANRTN